MWVGIRPPEPSDLPLGPGGGNLASKNLGHVGNPGSLLKHTVEQKSYQMPPQEGFTVAHFLTVADIDRSARFYETVFGHGGGAICRSERNRRTPHRAGERR